MSGILAWLLGNTLAGRIARWVVGILTLGAALWGAKALYDRSKRNEGRTDERNRQNAAHVKAIEQANRAGIDGRSGSARAQRLRERFTRRD